MVQKWLVFNADWHNSKVGIIVFCFGDSSLSVRYYCDFTDFKMISPIGTVQISGLLLNEVVTLFCQ
jgi:hypothetical protein